MANRRYIDFPIASTSGDTDIILIWQDGANKQTTKATFLSGLPENLEDLNDVVISGLTNGQILRYDSVTGKWENTDQGNLDLNDLNDVSIVSPSNGQVLVYNSSTSKWENSSGGYVPYVGAVTTVDLGAQGLRAGYVRFDTTVAGVPNEQGLMFWDADDETVDIILNGYTMKIGEDLFYPVKNQTGSTIAKGVAVRFNGTVGASGRLLIAPFIADGSVPSSRFMGVTAEEILNGEDGKVLYFGRVRGINTDAFNEGDILYASTTVAGGYQTAIPLPPNNIVEVAAVISKSPTVGTIFVRPTLGSNINTDEGVKITSVADKNLLQYQSGTSLWENKTLAQVLGGTSSQFVKGDGSLDSTSYGTGTVTSVGLSSATSGVTIGSSPVTTSGTITLAIATASGSQNGLLSSTDWTTFNNKQNALTNPVTGTGASGQVAYFTGTSAISSESNLFWDATNDRLGILTSNPLASLQVGNGTQTAINEAGNKIHIATNNTRSALVTLANSSGGATIEGIFESSAESADLRVIIGATSNHAVILRSNNTEAMRIFTSRNVHIGPTPASDNGARLQVSGTGMFSDTVTFNGSNNVIRSGNELRFNRTDNLIYTRLYDAGSTFALDNRNGNGFSFQSAGTNQMVITSSGNVGIGTGSPSYRLVVNSGTDGISAGIAGSTYGIRFDNGGTFSSGMSTIHGVDSTLIGSYQPIMLNGLDVRFGTSANERMRITSSGNVLIGTTTDSGQKMQVYSSGTTRIRIDAGGNNTGVLLAESGISQWSLASAGTTLLFYNELTGQTRFSLTSTGAATFNSLGTGTVTATAGLLSTTSDMNLKIEDGYIDSAIGKVLSLKPRYFYWNEKSGLPTNIRQLGFYAQEVNEALGEEAANTPQNENTPWGISDRSMIAMLTKAIQELKQEIDTLKN